jgi:hypothetical protein
MRDGAGGHIARLRARVGHHVAAVLLGVALFTVTPVVAFAASLWVNPACIVPNNGQWVTIGGSGLPVGPADLRIVVLDTSNATVFDERRDIWVLWPTFQVPIPLPGLQAGTYAAILYRNNTQIEIARTTLAVSSACGAPGGGGGGGTPNPGATPELGSLALFGSGAASLASLAWWRGRGPRRRVPGGSRRGLER